MVYHDNCHEGKFSRESRADEGEKGGRRRRRRHVFFLCRGCSFAPRFVFAVDAAGAAIVMHEACMTYTLVDSWGDSR